RGVQRPDERPHNRLYAVESVPTTTGAAADHRLPLRAGLVETFTRALARALGLEAAPGQPPDDEAIPARWIDAVARDLQAHSGAGLVIPGDHHPPAVHALAHAINQALGNVGQTVTYIQPVISSPANQTQSLRDLVAAMNAGEVELLLILGGNPVYDAPADLEFAAALEQVGMRVHHSLYADETAAACDWHLPEAHYLETWGDARAYDGTVTIQQPVIEPLYAGRSPLEVLELLLAETPEDARTAAEIVADYWQAQVEGDDFDAFWQAALRDGLIIGSAFSPQEIAAPDLSNLPPPAEPAAPEEGSTLEINFR